MRILIETGRHQRGHKPHNNGGGPPLWMWGIYILTILVLGGLLLRNQNILKDKKIDKLSKSTNPDLRWTPPGELESLTTTFKNPFDAGNLLEVTAVFDNNEATKAFLTKITAEAQKRFQDKVEKETAPPWEIDPQYIRVTMQNRQRYTIQGGAEIINKIVILDSEGIKTETIPTGAKVKVLIQPSYWTNRSRIGNTELRPRIVQMLREDKTCRELTEAEIKRLLGRTAKPKSESGTENSNNPRPTPAPVNLDIGLFDSSKPSIEEGKIEDPPTEDNKPVEDNKKDTPTEEQEAAQTN